MSTSPEQATDGVAATITVYWRPGCPFCGRLLRWIDRRGVPTVRRNVWDEPDAAAAVRAITGGDETVPTVTIGRHAMVNPSPMALRSAIATHAPDLLPGSSAPPPGWWGRVSRSG